MDNNCFGRSNKRTAKLFVKVTLLTDETYMLGKKWEGEKEKIASKLGKMPEKSHLLGYIL